MIYQEEKSRQGQLSLQLLIFITVMVILIGGFVLWAGSFLNLSLRGYNRAQAFTIAEAGIEYYRWHLAHAPEDYQDGTGSTGPYVHNYFDKDGNLIGSFKLEITPPITGSTVVTIRSTGQVASDSTIEKIVEVRMGIPSIAKYAVAVNDNVRFGEGTEVWGEIISNGGIRFDGLTHNLIKSAQSSYDDPDHGGQNEFGVHTHLTPIDPEPPAAVPDRTDVFEVGRQFPVPAVDFTGFSQDLSNLKNLAQSGGYYVGSSTNFGYNLVLATSGIFSVYEVTSLVNPPNGCTNNSNQDGWGTWSIQNQTLIATGTFPVNGVFFFGDDLWVEGQIDGARLTIASAQFPDNPSTRTSITVNHDLLYTNYDGQDALALIAQNNFNVGWASNDFLRIDSALIAQNGRVGRYYYRPPNNQAQNNRCAPNDTRDTVTLYGMLASNQRYGFGYTDITGYINRNIIYDPNLLFAPPPHFPQSSDQYEIISWDEVK